MSYWKPKDKNQLINHNKPYIYIYTKANCTILQHFLYWLSSSLPFLLTVGRTTVSYLVCLFYRLRTEHWVRHRGVGRKDILFIWLPFWPYIWWNRSSASSTFIHGRDPGRTAVCWPVEKISWHWDRDDYHKSRQVRYLAFCLDKNKK